jgi:glycosyltransferase involved in cell wall biosynthesis
MLISFYTPHVNLTRSTGYGIASANIIESLEKLGHQVGYGYPKAEVQINFSQPFQFKLHKNQYQIGYTPWESSIVPKTWWPLVEYVDEMWATSDWTAEVFENNGIKKPIYVYPHGVDPMWKPKKREQKDVIKFLHIGEPAPRKAGQMVLEAFIHLFGNDPRYSLTIKAHLSNTTRVKDNFLDDNIIGLPDEIYSNIRVIKDEYTEEQLVKLYHDHDVLVYPTYGEGFGFIPLQALATGMPTICTYDWAQYKKFLGPLALKSRLTKSPFMNLEGLVFEPNYQHLVELMKEVVLDFKAYSGYYYAQSTKIHQEYNWLELTKNAFNPIFKKFINP